MIIKIEALEIESIQPKLHSMDIKITMNAQQKRDALAVLCEEMGDDAFLDEVNNILGISHET